MGQNRAQWGSWELRKQTHGHLQTSYQLGKLGDRRPLLTESLVCARRCADHFTCVISFDRHENFGNAELQSPSPQPHNTGLFVHKSLCPHIVLPPHTHHSSFQPSSHPYIHSRTIHPHHFLFFLPTIHSFIHLSIHPHMYLSVYSLIHLSIHPHMYLSIYSLIHLSIHPHMYLSIHPFIHPSTHPSNHSSSSPMKHPFIHHHFSLTEQCPQSICPQDSHQMQFWGYTHFLYHADIPLH